MLNNIVFELDKDNTVKRKVVVTTIEQHKALFADRRKGRKLRVKLPNAERYIFTSNGKTWDIEKELVVTETREKNIFRTTTKRGSNGNF